MIIGMKIKREYKGGEGRREGERRSPRHEMSMEIEKSVGEKVRKHGKKRSEESWSRKTDGASGEGIVTRDKDETI